MGGVSTVCDLALKVLCIVGLHRFGAELLLMLVTASIAVLLLTAIHHTSHSHTVTDLEVLDSGTNLGNVTNNLVPAVVETISVSTAQRPCCMQASKLCTRRPPTVW